MNCGGESSRLFIPHILQVPPNCFHYDSVAIPLRIRAEECTTTTRTLSGIQSEIPNLPLQGILLALTTLQDSRDIREPFSFLEARTNDAGFRWRSPNISNDHGMV
ncbi:hypothetical protein N7453_005156 [Penicillium expansum]|nr:hypothetical protein N7453_005156 [Penicillium expansum]